MKKNYLAALLLFIAFFQFGCGSEQVKNQPLPSPLQMEPLKGVLSTQDQEFVQAVQMSVATAGQKMGELESALEEMEELDESHEAIEMMEQARQEILYLWNKIHNEYHPDHPELKKLKEYYEGILYRYREGISLEMEGMERGDASKMKKGYEMTGQAIENLRELTGQINKIKRK